MRSPVTIDELTMKIYVNQIPEEGMQHHTVYDPSAMDMERVDVHVREPYEVDAWITKAERELIVNAQIRCSLQFTCARCLDEFPQTIRTSGLFSYQFSPTDVVDMTEDVRQEIILAYPMIPVCRPDCKGLCSACGQNLNVAACRHDAA